MPPRDASITAGMNELLCLDLSHLPTSLLEMACWGGHHQHQGFQNTTRKKDGITSVQMYEVFSFFDKYWNTWFFCSLGFFVCLFVWWLVWLVDWFLFLFFIYFCLCITDEHFYLYKNNNNILGLHFKWTLVNEIGQLYWPQQATAIYLGFAF